MKTREFRIWMELDSSAFAHNARILKECAGNNMLAAVIKGNGYGHGLIQMAVLCNQSNDIDFLCVAYLSEALLLRTHGITKPIVVLSCIDDDIEKSVHQKISFMIDSYELADQLESIGKQYKYIFNVHIKIDTGLSRHGVLPKDMLVFLHVLSGYNYIRIEGIYSHFVQSHLDDQTITNQQRETFENAIQSLLPLQNTFIHMSNSASLLAGTAPKVCNFFRTGLALYGLWPSEYIKSISSKKIDLYPIMSLKTYILQIKFVPAYTPIGYNQLYTTTQDALIAILPVGYADGLPSSLSNKGCMSVNGQAAPIVGKIAMNTSFLDVTNIKDVAVGSTVTIIGEKISAQLCADKAQILNVRELLTGFKGDIQKVII